MRIYLLMCLLLGSFASLQATLFFWNDSEENLCCLHYNSYDICVEGGGYTGFNHIDVSRVKNYIRNRLMLSQKPEIKSMLKRLLLLLGRHSLNVSYRKEYTGIVNRLLPIDPTATATAATTPKPLTTEQKKEAIQRILASQGLSRPFTKK
jgi:hypothetical protein